MVAFSTPEGERAAIEAFKRDVVDASMQSLVILDFWAEWSGPCKQLGPVLEKVAGDYADKGVRLVKIDIDKNPAIAAQFRVQSIPTVYAVFQGQPIADMTPARTEIEITTFLDQILPQLPIAAADGHDTSLANYVEAAAVALAAGAYADAEKLYAALTAEDPANADYAIGLARARLGLDDIEGAASALATVPADSKTAGAAQVRAALDVARKRVPKSEIDALRAAVDAAPGDHARRLTLAIAQAAGGERDAAADNLLGIIKAEPGWNDNAARGELLKLFESVGLDDPWVAAMRRKLSAVLFA